MTESEKKKGKAVFFILFGIFLVCGSFFVKYQVKKSREERQEEISAQVLRFHIRANSDRDEDQNLKLKVKTQIVSYLQKLLCNCQSREESKIIIRQHLGEIEQIADRVCRQENQPTQVKAYLTRENFPLKQYGDMIFPSGQYDALRIDLGKAEGKNWWCMMYPSLCMIDGVVEKVPEESKEKIRKEVSMETYESLLIQKRKYHIKFKLREMILCLEK